MNYNAAIKSQPRVAWDGTVAREIDIRHHNKFAWAFEVITALTADTTFTVQYADPDPADNCVPGAFANAQAIATCESDAIPGDASITLPAGTAAGTICAGTIACRPGAFVRLDATAGETGRVIAAMVLYGPRNTGVQDPYN